MNAIATKTLVFCNICFKMYIKEKPKVIDGTTNNDQTSGGSSQGVFTQDKRGFQPPEPPSSHPLDPPLQIVLFIVHVVTQAAVTAPFFPTI